MKASVFPLPVFAAPRISVPFNARGMALAWISVSSTKWEDLRPALVKSERGRSVKFL
jgi:hypothetical protein